MKKKSPFVGGTLMKIETEAKTNVAGRKHLLICVLSIYFAKLQALSVWLFLSVYICLWTRASIPIIWLISIQKTRVLYKKRLKNISSDIFFHLFTFLLQNTIFWKNSCMLAFGLFQSPSRFRTITLVQNT